MEYLEGRTLKYYLKDEEPLDLDNVFAVSIQLAEGLASAHAKGIVHRDLKPGNIFVTRVLALFTVGDVYASLCKKGAYAPFSAQRRSRALF